jgi:hypothetical protein
MQKSGALCILVESELSFCCRQNAPASKLHHEQRLITRIIAISFPAAQSEHKNLGEPLFYGRVFECTAKLYGTSCRVSAHSRLQSLANSAFDEVIGTCCRVSAFRSDRIVNLESVSRARTNTSKRDSPRSLYSD